MSRELSVEEIESIRSYADDQIDPLHPDFGQVIALCDMALRAKAAEQRAGELAKALEATHNIALRLCDAKNGTSQWTDARHDFMSQMKINQEVFERAVQQTKSTPALGEGER